MKRRIAQVLAPPQPTPQLPQTLFLIGRGFASGYLDNLQVDAGGLIRLQGWCCELISEEQFPTITVDGTPVALLNHFRFPRPDVQLPVGCSENQSGVAWEYLVPESAGGVTHSVELRIPGGAVKFEVPVQFHFPHYGTLYSSTDVYHRQHIYASGPPNTVIHPDVLNLALRLRGPVLDFGCGRGILIGALLKAGVEAQGIEVDSPGLRAAIPANLLDRITLYSGAFPSPFGDASFRSIFCSEVLEHIPDYQAAVADLARIAREVVVFTVPDASAIPVGYRHGVVPWHLMESTHVNFFNQHSLGKVLAPYFSRVEFGRAGLAVVNDSSFYVSLTATCYK